jgi:hypothetical protein
MDQTKLPDVKGVITMACPFKGAAAARLMAPAIPACRDITPGAAILDRIAGEAWRVRMALVSGFDFLVPESSQTLPGMPSERMNGFQHMDFIVGSEDRVRLTAERIFASMD